MAPEVLRCPFKSKPEENKEKSELHYSNRVDAWAVGEQSASTAAVHCGHQLHGAVCRRHAGWLAVMRGQPHIPVLLHPAAGAGQHSPPPRAGVLTYELLVGFPPFFDQSRTGTEDRIRSSIPVFPSNMSEDAKVG